MERENLNTMVMGSGVPKDFVDDHIHKLLDMRTVQDLTPVHGLKHENGRETMQEHSPLEFFPTLKYEDLMMNNPGVTGDYNAYRN